MGHCSDAEGEISMFRLPLLTLGIILVILPIWAWQGGMPLWFGVSLLGGQLLGCGLVLWEMVNLARGE